MPIGVVWVKPACSNILKAPHCLFKWHFISLCFYPLAAALPHQGWGIHMCPYIKWPILLLINARLCQRSFSVPLFKCAVGENKLLRIFSHSSCVCLRQSWVRALLLMFIVVVTADSTSDPAAQPDPSPFVFQRDHSWICPSGMVIFTTAALLSSK